MRPLVSFVLLLALSTAVPTLLPAQTADLSQVNELMGGQKWAEAKAALEEIVSRPGEHAQAWLALGRCHHQLGELDAAIDAYERSAAQNENTAPRALYGAARAAASAGRKSQAIELLDRVADSGGTPYLAASNAPEFASFRDTPRFQAVLDRLRPCNTAEFHRFDFWVGEWNVMVGDRHHAVSRISRDLGTCVVREDYLTLRGFAGTSLSFYDSTSGRWHQVWIDNLGQVLRIAGDLEGNRMVMTSDPGEAMNRMAWTPNDDGTVRQVAESSTDGGQTWTVGFDGLYVPRAAED